MKLNFNSSYKIHFLIGIFISLWLIAFLIFIAPFDIYQLSLKNRFILLPFYGLICLTSYMLLIPVQNFIYKRFKKWTVIFETSFFFAFVFLELCGSYLYYSSPILNGEYNFAAFTINIFFPTFFLLISIIILLRHYFFKKQLDAQQKITINGDNKLDTLSIPLNDLLYISSADNYIEVNYMIQDKVLKKLLRTTLKKVTNAHPSLLRTHRSFLINPQKFTEWKNASTILIEDIEIPVSKTYKSSLLELNSSQISSI